MKAGRRLGRQARKWPYHSAMFFLSSSTPRLSWPTSSGFDKTTCSCSSLRSLSSADAFKAAQKHPKLPHGWRTIRLDTTRFRKLAAIFDCWTRLHDILGPPRWTRPRGPRTCHAQQQRQVELLPLRSLHQDAAESLKVQQTQRQLLQESPRLRRLGV